MEKISPVLAPAQVQEEIQVLLLKKALKMEETQKLALIDSVQLTSPSQSLDSSVGRVVNEKV